MTVYKVDFKEWRPIGLPGDHSLDVGEVHYGIDGRLTIDVRDTLSENITGKMVFLAPLAIRIAGEGSLMDYWRAGVVVQKHSLFVATSSAFLDWLERSSSGVHGGGKVAHYAVFSDDACIEVLSSDEPFFQC